MGEYAPGTYAVGLRNNNLLVKVDNRTSQLIGTRLEKPMTLFTIKY